MTTPRAEAHVYFSDTIGMGDWFYGTTANDVRYCVEGWSAYDGGSLPDGELPAKVILHFPACNGGDVVEGYGIYNYLRGLAARGVLIEARVEGLAASIATLVALAADTVLMADAALWMTHKPSVSGCSLNADDMATAIVLLDKIQAQIAGRYVARSGGKLDLAMAHELMNKVSWLNADECIAYGFATGKLNEEPLAVPQGAEKVLNYFPATKHPAPTMAITPAEETRLVDRFINAAKEFFAPKNEAAPAVTNAATSFPATDDAGAAITLYCAEADIATDSALFTDEALSIAAADGNYTLEDGREITVLAGSVSEMEATAAAETPVTNAAADTAVTDALTAEVAELKNQLATATNQVKNLKAKVAKAVPGSAGNPTLPGAAQTITNKAGGAAKSADLPIRFTA